MYQVIFLVERGIRKKIRTCWKCDNNATFGANKGALWIGHNFAYFLSEFLVYGFGTELRIELITGT